MLRGHGPWATTCAGPMFGVVTPWRSSGECPQTYPLLRLYVSHLQNNGLPRDQESSILRRYPTLHGCAILWFNPGGCAQFVSALAFWFLDYGLQLNSSICYKSKAMILGTRPGLSKLSPYASLVIGGDVVVKDCIKILGLYLDPTLSMDTQVKASIKACNYHIRAPQHVGRGQRVGGTDAWRRVHDGLMHTQICQVDRLRSRNVPSRLLQLADVRHLHKSNLNKLQRVQSYLGRAPSSLEFQLWALVQTASPAPSLAKDYFQAGTHHIQREILRATIISPVSRTTPSRNLWSEGQHLLRIPFRRSAWARQQFEAILIRKLGKLTHSIHSIKTRLKAELFSTVFQWFIVHSSLFPLAPESPLDN